MPASLLPTGRCGAAMWWKSHFVELTDNSRRSRLWFQARYPRNQTIRLRHAFWMRLHPRNQTWCLSNQTVTFGRISLKPEIDLRQDTVEFRHQGLAWCHTPFQAAPTWLKGLNPSNLSRRRVDIKCWHSVFPRYQMFDLLRSFQGLIRLYSWWTHKDFSSLLISSDATRGAFQPQALILLSTHMDIDPVFWQYKNLNVASCQNSIWKGMKLIVCDSFVIK